MLCYAHKLSCGCCWKITADSRDSSFLPLCRNSPLLESVTGGCPANKLSTLAVHKEGHSPAFAFSKLAVLVEVFSVAPHLKPCDFGATKSTIHRKKQDINYQ